MEYRILGPLEVVDGTSPVRIGRGKQRALLATLLLSAGRTVSRDRLIEDLWGEEHPETAPKMIQIYVSRLRKALPERTIDTQGRGYALAVQADALDLDRFLRLRAEGRTALEAGRPDDASQLLHEALSLWRGPALAEFEEPFAQAESPRLEELRLSAVEDRIEADLALGRHADLVAELEGLVARHPLRERLRAQHMRALYASGRQAEALAAYRAARRVLDEELGIEPSPMLKELERQILRQDPALAAAPPPEPVVPRLPEAAPRRPRVFGRAAELAELRAMLDRALAGERRLVFVEGEPGSGKTTLLTALLEDEARELDLRIGYGRCIEQRGEAEAYMPVLDALSRMCREPGGEEVLAVLGRRAPTWLVQMPWLVSAEELATLRARAIASTRDGMLREMVEALEALSEAKPLVLVLDDLHWSDRATLGLLEALAWRDEPARLLLLGTVWEADAKARGHPICTLVEQLRARNRCVGIVLRPLAVEAVRQYVSARITGAELPPEVPRLLRERTGGNPLFLENVVDGWIAAGLVEQRNGTWAVRASGDDLASSVPDSLRKLVEQDLLRLDDEDLQLLEAASIAGRGFSGAEVAAALETSAESVEARAEELARRGRLLERRGAIELPDGTVSERFRFRHELYQEVVYQRLPVRLRAGFHRRIGSRLEETYGARAPEIAAGLAFHFARGQDFERAVRYFELAARQSLGRGGYEDAVRHLRASLDALSRTPEGPEHSRYELELRSLLGQALVVTDGWSAPEAEAAFQRAHDLAVALGDNEPLVTVLLSLATLYEVRGEVARARELAEERLRLVPDATPQRELESNELLACSLLHQGLFTRALEQAELGIELSSTVDGHYDTFPGTLGDNAAVSCHNWAALALWYLGRPDEALRRAQAAVRMAQDPSRRYSLPTAQAQMALLHQCRLEPEATLEWADATVALATERGYAYRVATGRVLRGWATAVLGNVDEGIDELERGLRASRATGAHLDDPHHLGLLADAHLRGGQVDTALGAVTDALEIAERHRSVSYEAELRRLLGSVHLARGATAEAEASLMEALEVARRQDARTLELRAATTLAGLWRHQGRAREARSLLGGLYEGFLEGFDTPDLQAAGALLEELAEPRALAATRAPTAEPSPPAPSAAALRPALQQSPIRYTKSGGLNLAYQVTGDGPVDLVLVPGFVSHLEKDWDEPRHVRFLERLGFFSRLIRFDKRGTGLSDRPGGLPDLETRMDDVRAVMDAAGSERAVLFGYSEGGPMSVLFAATYPDRVDALVLYGTYARRMRADDYPWAATEEERIAYADRIEREWAWEADMRQMCPNADEAMARWWGERARAGASPGAARDLILMNSHIDVRDVLPAVRVRTLVLHRTGDPDAPVEGGRYIAEHIPGARFVELPGVDHFVAMDPDQILDEVEEFVTGVRPQPETTRVLGSILFSDVVRSTEIARSIGDRAWSELLAEHDRAFADVLGLYGGELVDTAGDGVLALFDGPARAIRCGLAVRDRLAQLGLEVRVGIHTGEIERQRDSVRGIAVHLAARVAAEAGAREVLVTSTTRDLVEGSGIAFAERGERQLKGFDTPRRLYAALSD
jgi:DNA-binding SARP family transcriptional activator/pimeloyl-ACP methyl ester carboxylesterase/predicted ATPase/type II secretory pathway predicted ATPase ExeA